MADTKFHSDAPFTGVDVVFKSREQIEALINGLQKLLAEASIAEILEVEDDNSTGDEGLSAPIYFHAPGFSRDTIDLRCLAAAADLMMQYQDDEETDGDG